MSQDTENVQQKKAEILDRLRENFGDDRSGELGDVDGVELLSTFLRRAPDELAEDATQAANALSRNELVDIRRRRRRDRQNQTNQQPGQETTPTSDLLADIDGDALPLHKLDDGMVLQSLKLEALVKEIPRLRDNFGEWLSSVEADFPPSSTPLRELNAHREKVEYRLKILTVMMNATQRELDDLIVAIRAQEASSEH